MQSLLKVTPSERYEDVANDKKNPSRKFTAR